MAMRGPDASERRPTRPATIREQLGAPYERYDAAAQRVHAELVSAVVHPHDLALAAERRGDGEWTLTVCMADHLGGLSVIAGLLTAHRIDIVNADVFTLELDAPPEPAPPAAAMRRRRGPRRAAPRRPERLALDSFELRTLEPAAPDWEGFERELRAAIELMATSGLETARALVMDRVSETLRPDDRRETRLLPVAIELDQDASPDATVMRISSPDTPGFLFEFTNALALLDANISRAEIRTGDGEARDAFWLTDARGRRKISDPAQLRNLRVAAALIKQFTHLLPGSANPAQALRQFSAFTRQLIGREGWADDLAGLDSGTVLETLAEMMGVSRFLWDDFLRIQHDNLFPVLVDAPALDASTGVELLHERLGARLRDGADHEARVRALNDFKDREMFRIDLRHITGRSGFEQFSRELSDLGDVVIGAAAGLSHAALAHRLPGGTLPPWCICALGKFGGRDMGFASDVEMLFLYDGDDLGPEVSAYFEQFVRTLIETLKVQRQGIFEIDLRLRPWGHGGPLANSLDGFRRYFAVDGDAQQFERLALVRLRPVAGDRALQSAVVAARDRFVYSGAPLDYENIRHLRRRQVAELVAPGTVNAKYSPGGVVDVEYFVQTAQIEAGASDERVRTPGTVQALERLQRGGHIDAAVAERARGAYGFLRRLIDALRVVRGNARDLAVPPTGDREFVYLARRLEFASGEQLQAAIASQMAAAQALWER